MHRTRISDAVRCLLLNVPNGPNLVCPSESLPDGGDLKRSAIWRDALAQPKDRVTLLSWNGMHLDGMVSARTRRGHRVWEIYQLYIPEPASGSNDRWYGTENPAFIALLEEVVPMAGRAPSGTHPDQGPRQESLGVTLSARRVLPPVERKPPGRPDRRRHPDPLSAIGRVARAHDAGRLFPLSVILRRNSPECAQRAWV